MGAARKEQGSHGYAGRLSGSRGMAGLTEEHCELAGMRLEVLETIANPERIFAGGAGELLAVRELYSGKHLVVVYREFISDGFIITAFLTSKTTFLKRKKQLWP